MATKNQKTNAAFDKKVRAAATELEKNGVRITNANVREKIGGGSFRDIGPVVKALLAEQSARKKAETEVPDMPEEIAELATAIWEGAYRCADEAAAADRRARAEEIKALREELSDKDDEVAIVEEERDAAIARAEAVEGEAIAQASAIQEFKVQIAALKGRLQGRADAGGDAEPETNGDADDKNSGDDADPQTDMFGLNGVSTDADRPFA